MSLGRWFLALPLLAAVAVVAVQAGVATQSGEQPPAVRKIEVLPGQQPVLPPVQSGGQAGQFKQPPRKVESSEIVQEFPGAGEQKTTWKVTYQVGKPRPGLLITGAWFKTGPSADWFQVLGEARLSEIFVPYNNGITRIYDIGGQGNYSLLKHTQADAGVHGQLLHDAMVVKEVRDTGILWKYYDKVRRGQELVLWSTISASNYNYLVEYAFRCDGSLTCRLGSTGKNYGNHETMGHMHHGCWHIDMNVGDKDHNSVSVVRRSEQPAGRGKAEDLITALKTEGGIEWRAEEFTRLRIESNQKNGQGHPISYELVPQRPGTGRHYGGNEEFTSKDFWVTPYKFDELYYGNVARYARQNRNIADTDVVIWYMSPAYHLPRDEDGLFVNGKGRVEIRGVAMTTWCGLELRPRNLFENSPLYP